LKWRAKAPLSGDAEQGPCAQQSEFVQIWEYKLKPEMGEPRSIRAFGDNVFVSTDKGKIIVLKAE